MFVYNFKLNSSFVFKFIVFVIIIVVLSLCGLVAYKLYNASIESGCEKGSNNECFELTNKNYSNILQMVHDNVDTYVGQKIKYSGYVYRVYDLQNNQFVLARNMIISSDFQYVIVGFLCQCDDAIRYADNTWVELEGEIVKGCYHGLDIPILEIKNIKQIDKPSDEFVYPPDNSYIPTAEIL